MVNRWRILRGSLNGKPENCDRIVKACTVLHNFLITVGQKNSAYCPPSYKDRILPNGNFVKGAWRMDNPNLPSLQPRPSLNSYEGGEEVREKYVDYFNGDGQVPWQNDHAFLHDY